MFLHAESIRKKEACVLAYSPFCARSGCARNYLFHPDVSSGNRSPAGRNPRANLSGYFLVVFAGMASALGSVSCLKCICF